MSAGVGVYNTNTNRNTRNYNHISALNGTISLAAYAVNQNQTIDGSATFSWASDNASIATVNSSGVVTAVASGTCNITATSSNGQGEGFFPLGVALLTLGSSSIAFGSSTTIAASGGGSSTLWVTGTPGCIALIGTYDQNTGFVMGASITINTISGAFTNPASGTASAHCPIDCIFQTGQTSVANLYLGTAAGRLANFDGIYASATLIVTNVPRWNGN